MFLCILLNGAKIRKSDEGNYAMNYFVVLFFSLALCIFFGLVSAQFCIN